MALSHHRSQSDDFYFVINTPIITKLLKFVDSFCCRYDMPSSIIRFKVYILTCNIFNLRDIFNKFEWVFYLELFLNFFQRHLPVFFERLRGMLKHLVIVISELLLQVPIRFKRTLVEISGKASFHSHSGNSPFDFHETFIKSCSERVNSRLFRH